MNTAAPLPRLSTDEQSAQQAIKNFRHAGVDECIRVITGDAKKILPTLDERYDLVFQDVGDKTLYPVLFDRLVALLNPGGVFLAEDSLFPVMDADISEPAEVNRMKRRKRSFESLEEFNRMVARHPFLRSTILPIGDGLTIGIKTG